MKTKDTALALLATLTLVALLVAACGGTDSSESSSTGDNTDDAAVHDGTFLVSTDGAAHRRTRSTP
jgi:hypothetical protein